MGLPADSSGVTVFACESPHHIATGSGYILSATDILSVIADSITTVGSAAMNGGGQVLLVAGPMTAQELATMATTCRRYEKVCTNWPASRLV